MWTELSGVDAAVLLVAIVIHISCVSVFWQVAHAIGGVTRGACLA